VLSGVFTEEPSDEHCRLRTRLLSAASLLPTPSADFTAAASDVSDVPDACAGRLAGPLRSRGLAVVQLDRPLRADDFRRLGARLGTLVPETDSAVQPYVEDGTVLNLLSDAGDTTDPSLQPFATTALALHSEGSGRAARTQPRYIVLMCVEPGDDGGACTVLVPMRAVEAALSAADDRLLRATRYRDAPGVPPIARGQDGRTVYSFRDFQDIPLRWNCAAERADPAAVNRAIRRLLARMYSSGEVFGVGWTRALLVVIDNTWFFHGRTAGRSLPSGRPRHLKRLRVR
jgi:hypothetical protein